MDCIFCRVVTGETPSDKVFENEKLLAFNDIYPKAKIHVLIIPKKHIDSIKELQEDDKELIGEMVLLAQKIAKDKKLEGYKLVVNVGKDGGQIVDHLHLHLLSGDASLI